MQEILTARLEASRKELLDLGLRNPLLNYRGTKARGLHIVQEKAGTVYDILVRQGKAMTFLGRSVKENNQIEIPEISLPALKEAQADTKLQTNEAEQKLQTNILNTYYFAKTSIEEQGVNILYLSLGMLQWYETGNTAEPRSAPLILVPVTLERSSAQERFRLKYTGSEIGANLSLQAKMLTDFNITIPDISDGEEFNPDDYFNEIEKLTAHQSLWKTDRDAIELGFFSFGKFMIYHDLDTEKWPEDIKPYKHPNFKALFGEGFSDAPPTAKEEDQLDNQTNANELFQVVDADSSQVLAMLAVNEGRNMVIQGPPGTGKSQTITNLIANAVGQGKKVLFVAEKMAALEVVKRRLTSISLGEICLELHSHKANKKDLHEELKRTLELGKPALEKLEAEILLLSEYRNELNEYCIAVNETIGKSGLSAQKIIGFLLQINKETPGGDLPKIAITAIEQWDANKMNRAEAMAERIQARLQDIGVPAQMPFYGSRLKLLLPHEQEPLLAAIQLAETATSSVQQAAKTVAAAMGIAEPVNEKDVTILLNITKLLTQAPDLKGLNIENNSWYLKKQDIQELLETGQRLNEIHQQYKDILITEAWGQPVAEMRQNLLAYGNKWYKFIVGSYKTAKRQLAGLCKTTLPDDLETKLQYLDAITEAKQLENNLAELEPTGTKLFSQRWEKQRSDWNTLKHAADYLSYVHQQIIEGVVPGAVAGYLTRHEPAETSAANEAGLRKKVAIKQDAIQQVVAKTDMDETVRFGAAPFSQQTFDTQLEQLAVWRNHLPEIHSAIAWNNLKDVAATEDLSFLIQAATHWDGAKNQLKTALQKTWYEYLVEQAISSPTLRKFERASHEEVVEKFKKLDLVNLQYNRARVALKHWENIPRQEAGGQVNILRSEFNRKARHMPIRKLVQEAGLAIQAIKPVFMMSPMSIANFLTPGSIRFDLVIFDEASQVRPVEAVGAMLRGQQLVVVGDTKQLPPTSFFDKLNTDTEDEENITADMQSILGMCDGQGAPQRMLRWHYRSRHESLISLSNNQFYDDRLVIFPSPGSRQRLGLVYHYLPEAVYDRGKTRSNPKEAEKVAQAVIDHAKNTPEQTLGVIAFSTAQMQAIQTILEIKRRQQPELESFFQSHPHEPFFVKNLENVQGDERDVIYISIGYGKVEDGKVPMSFGPLNNEGGERRLNVLITRAKSRCEVFTNITADEIRTTEASKFGIRALKSFLYFAQHGTLDIQEHKAAAAARPFEDVVAAALENLGYIIRKKVGTDGFYIDMAVVDEKNPGRYIAGIDCDGTAYATSRSARDRDRLRFQVLQAMGWKMIRVWSVDWYRNPERELKRLVESIEKAMSITLQLDDEKAIFKEDAKLLIRDTITETEPETPAYQMATLPAEIAKTEIHLHSPGKLAGWVEKVVSVETPIHMDELITRMVKAAGVTKAGSRIRETLVQATRYAAQKGTVILKGDFLWHANALTPVVRDRTELPASSRRLGYIAPEELQLAVKQVVESSIAIQPEAAVPLIARLFGFFRVTEDMRNELLNIINQSVANGTVTKDGEWLK